MTDQRSAEARAYRHLYKSRRWARYKDGELRGGLSYQALLRDGFRCQRCGLLIVLGNRAHAVHHIEDHKGDEALFFELGNLETQCSTCHSGPTQADSIRGYSIEIGPDGWPVDDRHPARR